MTMEWVMVPREPTEAIIRAGYSAPTVFGVRDMANCYRAMLAAAPSAPDGNEFVAHEYRKGFIDGQISMRGPLSPAAPQDQSARRKDMAAFAAELKADPVKQQAFFQSAGIINERGGLTPQYGGPSPDAVRDLLADQKSLPPELDAKMAARWHELYDVAPQQSEPVAWRIFDGEGGYDYSDDGPTDEQVKWSARWLRRHDPLFLHPPAAPQQAEPVTTLTVHLENSGGHAVSIDALYVDLPIGEHKLYLHPPADEVQRLRDALEHLIEKCGESDDAQYSTLGTKFVRAIARDALEGK